MQITVKNLYKRISPRKVRPVLHNFRNMNIKEAKIAASFVDKKAAGFLLDLIKAGIAAAKENYLETDKTIIKSIACNEGPRLKRFIPWSKGQSRRITKKMAHIVLTLEAPDAVKPTKKAAEKQSSPDTSVGINSEAENSASRLLRPSATTTIDN